MKDNIFRECGFDKNSFIKDFLTTCNNGKNHLTNAEKAFIDIKKRLVMFII